MSFWIALTGGIGSGKSAAANYFVHLGADLIDTDVIAHQLTAPEGKALPTLRDAFGESIFFPDGTLNRTALRQQVFSDLQAKTQLENILHPLIQTAVMQALHECHAPYQLIAIPLLLESGFFRAQAQRVCVVDCMPEQQIERVMIRSGLKAAEVNAILAQQVSRTQRLAAADDVLDNSSTLDALHQQIDKLHWQYLQYAA